jgi:hypothetical protein
LPERLVALINVDSSLDLEPPPGTVLMLSEDEVLGVEIFVTPEGDRRCIE